MNYSKDAKLKMFQLEQKIHTRPDATERKQFRGQSEAAGFQLTRFKGYLFIII